MFGFKFPASGSLPVILSSLGKTLVKPSIILIKPSIILIKPSYFFYLTHPVYVRAIACVAAGQFLEGEEKDRLPGFLMFFNTAPFLKLLRQPIRREIINTLLNSIKLN